MSSLHKNTVPTYSIKVKRERPINDVVGVCLNVIFNSGLVNELQLTQPVPFGVSATAYFGK